MAHCESFILCRLSKLRFTWLYLRYGAQSHTGHASEIPGVKRKQKCLQCAAGWEGGYGFLPGRDQCLHAPGLWPHCRSSMDSGASPEALGCCRRHCLVTQAWLVPWDSPAPSLRVILRLGVWPFECHPGCHAELGYQGVTPTCRVHLGITCSLSREQPHSHLLSLDDPIYSRVIQGWANPNPSQRCCWNSPFPGPRDPVLTLPG